MTFAVCVCVYHFKLFHYLIYLSFRPFIFSSVFFFIFFILFPSVDRAYEFIHIEQYSFSFYLIGDCSLLHLQLFVRSFSSIGCERLLMIFVFVVVVFRFSLWRANTCKRPSERVIERQNTKKEAKHHFEKRMKTIVSFIGVLVILVCNFFAIQKVDTQNNSSFRLLFRQSMINTYRYRLGQLFFLCFFLHHSLVVLLLHSGGHSVIVYPIFNYINYYYLFFLSLFFLLIPLRYSFCFLSF